MSTKIYDGLRIDTDDIFDFTNRLHSLIKQTFQDLAQELVMEEITRVFDGKASMDVAVFYEAEEKWKERQGKLSRHSVFEDPLRFSLVMGKTPGGKILAYPYYGKNEYFEALLTMPDVSPYGYWNNTDHEEGITDEQWNERRQEWDSIIEPEEGTFAHLPMYELSGSRKPFEPFVYEMFRGKKNGPVMEKLVSTQPSPEERLRSIFENACVDSFVTNVDTMMSDVSKMARAARQTPVEDMGELPAPITLDNLYGREHSNIVINHEEIIEAVKRAGLTPKPATEGLTEEGSTE